MSKLSNEELVEIMGIHCDKFDACGGCEFERDDSSWCTDKCWVDAPYEELERSLKRLGLLPDGEKQHDPVNHPSHYTQGSIECIDVITSALGKEAVAEFCLANSLKYIFRCKHKGSQVTDVKKAIWYLNKWLELVDGHDE